MDVISSLQQFLAERTNSEVSAYIDEVNDFPAIYIKQHVREFKRFGDEKHTIFNISVRGYTHSSIETALDDTEAFARSLERASQSFSRSYTVDALTSGGIITTQSGLELSTQSLLSLAYQTRTPTVEDCRVLSITTDEGLLAPYGVCDLVLGATYVSYS